jgi:DNA-binding response OmpR family regulator
MNYAKKRILISDCDAELLISLERVLEDEGFDTTTVCTTNETVRLLHGRAFDLALIADHPPELNCEAILRDMVPGGTQIIALENRTRHPFAEPYLLSLGARRIVHKWDSSEVLRAVKEALAGNSTESTKSGVAAAAKLG